MLLLWFLPYPTNNAPFLESVNMYRLMYVIHLKIKLVDTYLLHGCVMLNGDVVDGTICLRDMFGDKDLGNGASLVWGGHAPIEVFHTYLLERLIPS